MANSTIDQDTNQGTGVSGQPPQTEDIQNPFPGGEPPEDDQKQKGDQESLSDRIKSGYNSAQNIKKLTGAKEAAEAAEGTEAATGAEGAAGATEGAAGAAEGAATAGEGALGAMGSTGVEAAGATAAAEGASAVGAAGTAGATSAAAGGAAAASSAAATAATAVAGEAAAVTAVGVGATPVGWIAAGIGIVLLLIIVIIFFFKSSPQTDTQTQAQQQQTGTGTIGATCGGTAGTGTSTGSLDYTLPLKDVSVLPQNVNQIQDQVASQWPNAHLYDWDHIVDAAVRAGWNPSLILALWIEESGAQGASGYTDALGCDPSNPTTDINKSLNCVFNSFKDPSLNFEDFMCVYGGDGFHKAPCTFNTQNPNFPGNIKNWYTKLTGGTGDSGSSATPLVCAPSAPGDWPAAGLISQGPQGATDHARLATYGWNAIDIAGIMNEPIKSAFDGTVSAVHDCIVDGDCSGGYNGFGNSVEITTNTDKGSFTALYGHLSEIDTSLNATIKAGDTIGIMGTTGHSTGIHLHYQFVGAEMAPPNIPEAIVPLDCDSTSECSPSSIVPGSKPTPAL